MLKPFKGFIIRCDPTNILIMGLISLKVITNIFVDFMAFSPRMRYNINLKRIYPISNYSQLLLCRYYIKNFIKEKITNLISKAYCSDGLLHLKLSSLNKDGHNFNFNEDLYILGYTE